MVDTISAWAENGLLSKQLSESTGKSLPCFTARTVHSTRRRDNLSRAFAIPPRKEPITSTTSVWQALWSLVLSIRFLLFPPSLPVRVRGAFYVPTHTPVTRTLINPPVRSVEIPDEVLIAVNAQNVVA